MNKKTEAKIIRITSIAGLTFCTTLIATGFDSYTSIINAILLSGIALFTELKLESESLKTMQKIASMGLLL